jgi:hypothetical protein
MNHTPKKVHKTNSKKNLNIISSSESEPSLGLKQNQSSSETKLNKEYLRRISMNIPKLDLYKSVDNSETATEDSSSAREKFFTTTDSSYEDITSELSAVESANIKGVVISVWDNTLGPKLLRVWNGKVF